ncbi:MAG: hypothetical protein AMDU2_EPLC00005G0118 [Thermoplasmatales archaeon E-plasma]|jgi:sugar fermentation stimulation protein A|nr:MAG: hypothetical protein AMDU2_EPLC00005G0118 [Thermoplasmatales archaeon E-plasma]MCL4348157.1 DNA/RNA nuclease SfsA [Candidatus Thermoplasmatota archaeon]MCL5787815.1 DNA/RNA nuclease SfsA [Candidatus Thermoplasmatota archaeon]
MMSISFPRIGTEILHIKEDLCEGTIISRPNRFLTSIQINGEVVNAHLHDPGRLKELIYPGNYVQLRKISGKKTNYSILSAKSENGYILLDTRFHSTLARSFIKGNIKEEVSYLNSRFDFECDHEIIEIKGGSLVKDLTLIFPDAVTSRGTKHLKELLELHHHGRKVSVIMLCFASNATRFSPNYDTDPKFAGAFVSAFEGGVNFYFPKLGLEGNNIIYYGLINDVIVKRS